jgi:SAM-dependent methyltransferase
MMQPSLNWQTAPGYEVLIAAGKTVLRPGGRAATEQLFQWADFKPGATVLELASGLGTSAIALAKRYGVRVVGIEKNPNNVAIAQERVQAAKLDSHVQIIQGNIFRLDAIAETFDYVWAEAILTMQTAEGKTKILHGVRDRLKPTGKFLSQELIVRNPLEEIHRDLSRTLHVNATPLLESDWIDVYARTDFKIEHRQTGAMKLLDPIQVIRDEGITRTAQIVWNIATNSEIRDRILAMQQVFRQYQQDLGYIVLCAVTDS